MVAWVSGGRWWALSSGVDFTVAPHYHLHYHFQVILAVFVVVARYCELRARKRIFA